MKVPRNSKSELAVKYHCYSLSEAKACIYLVPHEKVPTVHTMSYSLSGSATGVFPKVSKCISEHVSLELVLLFSIGSEKNMCSFI